MDTAARIAIILPPREHFRPEVAGAVALTIRDFYLSSADQSELVVYGGFIDHFSDVRYHVVKPSFWRIIGRNLAYANACVQDLVQNGIELVEVHNRVQLALRIKAAAPHLKVAIYLHNDPQSMAGLKTASERAAVLQRLDMVYCVSDYVKQRLLADLESVRLDAKFAARVRVIYNAIPPSTPYAYSNREKWIVYAGRFVAQKGVLELAQALAELLPQFPEWKVVFLGAKGFGHPAGKSKYEQDVYAELAHVANQTDFRGHVSHREVIEVMGQASIAVSASVGAEAFGRTTLEAMDAGCAVITSASGGLKEVAGDAAVVIDPVSLASLTEALTTLMQDGALRLACAERCQLYARDTFSLAVQSANLDATRAELLGRPT